MTVFLLLGALMLIAALTLALFVFVFPRPPDEKDAREENIAAARRRLRALRAQKELADEDAAELEMEIKERLLAETDKPVAAPPVFRPGPDKAGIAVVCAALVPGALALYLYLGAPFAAVAPPHPDLTEKIRGLQEYVRQNPEDAKALALMGRIMAAMGRDEEAADYFARAVQAAKKNKSENGEKAEMENN